MILLASTVAVTATELLDATEPGVLTVTAIFASAVGPLVTCTVRAARLRAEIAEETTACLWFEDGYSASNRILAGAQTSGRFAILAVTDDLAIGGFRAIRLSATLRVPDDIAVMGLDGTHEGALSDWVGLTSIELPAYRMREEAVRLVLDEADPGHRHQRVVLPVGLKAGETIGH